MNDQIYYLRSSHIAQLLGAPDDGDMTYFYKVQLQLHLRELLSQKELDGTMVHIGTHLTNPMKACDLTKMELVFWQMVPQVGHHRELSSYIVYTL